MPLALVLLMSELPTITIQHSDAKAAIRLDSMLNVLGSEGRAATWKVRSVECIGSHADRLHAAFKLLRAPLAEDHRQA